MKLPAEENGKGDTGPTPELVQQFADAYCRASDMMEAGGEIPAHAYFLRHGQILFAMWLGITEEPAGKSQLMQQLGEFARKVKADAVLFVAEWWQGSLTEEERQLRRSLGLPPLLPTEDPDRSEVVIFSCHTPAGMWGTSVPLSRDGNGKSSLSANPPELTRAKEGGRMGYNLFAPVLDVEEQDQSRDAVDRELMANRVQRIAFESDVTATDLAGIVRRATSPFTVIGAHLDDDGMPASTAVCAIAAIEAHGGTAVIVAVRNGEPMEVEDLAQRLEQHGDRRVIAAIEGQQFRLYSVLTSETGSAIILGGPIANNPRKSLTE